MSMESVPADRPGLTRMDQRELIKLLVVTDGAIYPFSSGAPGQMLYQVLTRLADTGRYHVTVVYGHAEHAGSEAITALADNLLVWQYQRSSSQVVRLIKKTKISLKICRLVKDCHLVLFNTPPVSIFSLPLIWARLLDKKCLYIAHGGLFMEPPSAWQKALMHALHRRSFLVLGRRFLSCIIAVSASLQAIVSKLMPEQCVKVVHNGISTSNGELYEFNVSKIDPERKEFTLGYIGRLEPIKNVEVLLEAFSRVYCFSPRNRLIIAGKGGLESALREKARELHIEDSVQFVGHVSGKRKEDFFRAIDLLILPSRYESFGLVILEAMVAGIPVVAANAGGIPEIIKHGENGVLFPPDDAEILAKEIMALLSNATLMKRYVVLSKKRAENLFSWDVAARRYDVIFQEVWGSEGF